MQELKERGAQIFTNPYVIQVDKFAGSLKKLSDTFAAVSPPDIFLDFHTPGTPSESHAQKCRHFPHL